MKIGVITVNFHSDEDTIALLSGLENNKFLPGIDHVFYIVDNSKSTSLKEGLYQFPHAVYVESPGNVGFAKGNNIGLQKALEDGADIVVLINNDTLVPDNFLESIISSPITDEGVGIVGGHIYFAKGYEFEDKYQKKDLGKVFWYAGGKYDWNNVYASHIGVNEVDRGQYEKIRPTDFITGCLLVTKADILKKTGLFDERYCLYFEDSDLCLRVKNQGYSLLIDPKVKLWHKVAQSSSIGSSLNDYFLTRNRLLFGMTYARFRTKVALLREAFKKLLIGTPAQKLAVSDFLLRRLGWGSWPH